VELAKPWLSKLPTGVLKHMMMLRLAELSQLSPEMVAHTLGMPGPQAALGKGAPATPRRGNAQRRPTKTPVRSGIELLLHTPQLAAAAGEVKRWEILDIPGLGLFIELLELLQAHPHLHSGAILERWRGTPEGQQLAELAKWEPILPEASLEQEFRGIVQWLDTEVAKLRRDELTAKWQHTGLTPAEKAELLELQRRCSAATTAAPH
jgi:DNA primase